MTFTLSHRCLWLSLTGDLDSLTKFHGGRVFNLRAIPLAVCHVTNVRLLTQSRHSCPLEAKVTAPLRRRAASRRPGPPNRSPPVARRVARNNIAKLPTLRRRPTK